MGEERGQRADHGIQTDSRGQYQPSDKTRAQQVTRAETPRKTQRDAVTDKPPAPSAPAGRDIAGVSTDSEGNRRAYRSNARD